MLETVWDVVMGLLNHGKPVTFESIYTAMPEELKVKPDPRPDTVKMRDWKFAEHFPDWKRRLGNNKFTDRSMFETHPPNMQLMGSCWAQSTTNCVEGQCNEISGKRAFEGIRLSPQYTYHFAELMDGHPGPGTYGWAACDALRKHGVCLDDLYTPVAKFEDLHAPTAEAVADAMTRCIEAYYLVESVEQIAAAQAMRMDVALSFLRPIDAVALIDVGMWSDFMLVPHSEKVHSVNLVNGRISLQNSWGMMTAGGGCETVTRRFLEKHWIEVRAIQYRS